MAQFRKLLSQNKQLQSIPWKFVLRILLTFIVLFVLWSTLRQQEQGFADIWHVIRRQLTKGEAMWLLILLLLVPVNWALESLKWQLLVRKIFKISFGDAVTSTLTGLLSGLALPAQIGDVVGRVASLKTPERSKTLGAALLSGGIQFYVAVFAGLWGIYAVRWQLQLSGSAFLVLVSLLWGIILLGFLFFAFRKPLLATIPSHGYWQRVRSALEVMSAYDDRELLAAFGVGAGRYAVYLAQFVAGLLIFDFPLPLREMAACVALVLMVKTLLPALNLLGDLGLRGVTAVFIFGKFGIPPDLVIAVTLFVWFTNILLPALFGLLLVWRRQ